jgi:hypothetical protein
MRRFIASPNSIPILFAFITILAYGLLLPFTGFYWDDWPFAWIAKFLGPAEFIPAFISFRPFLGPIFFFTTSLIPPYPLYWQIIALAVRFLLGLAAWWMFKSIWPERPRFALGAALLLLVFPGYSQHWVAFTHINQELIPLLFYILSFGFTARALRSGQPLLLTGVAILLQVCGLFPTEYFFGLEALRFLFIYAILSTPNTWVRARQAFKLWLPYLIVWILNAAWLIYYYKFGPYASYEVTVSHSLTLPSLFLDLTDTVWKAGFYIWGQIIVLIAQSVSAPASLIALGLITGSFVLLTVYGLRLNLPEESDRTFAISALLIGLIGIIVGRLPSLAAGLPLRLQSSYDRFMVSMLIGGSLFMLGLVELLFGKSRLQSVVLALLISLGIGQQFFNANIFRRDWQKQAQIYWQLAWRIPAMQPDTVLLTQQMPIDYETDLSFTAPINWMYAPDFVPPRLPYALLYTEKRLGGSTLPALQPGIEINFAYRTVRFSGNTSQAIVIYMPVNGCLRVLDPAIGDAATYEREPASLVDAIPLSNPSLIIADPPIPARPMFFPEPPHAWCYYYTKAELARQAGEWSEIVAMGNKAVALGYAPEDPVEWLPFIEANARTGDWDTAESLARKTLAQGTRLRKGLCQVWYRARTQVVAQSADESRVVSLLSEFGCTP